MYSGTKYDELINVIIDDKCIAPYIKRRHSQHTIDALPRSCAVLVNQEILMCSWLEKTTGTNAKNCNLRAARKVKTKTLKNETTN